MIIFAFKEVNPRKSANHALLMAAIIIAVAIAPAMAMEMSSSSVILTVIVC